MVSRTWPTYLAVLEDFYAGILQLFGTVGTDERIKIPQHLCTKGSRGEGSEKGVTADHRLATESSQKCLTSRHCHSCPQYTRDFINSCFRGTGSPGICIHLFLWLASLSWNFREESHVPLLLPRSKTCLWSQTYSTACQDFASPHAAHPGQGVKAGGCKKTTQQF